MQLPTPTPTPTPAAPQVTVAGPAQVRTGASVQLTASVTNTTNTQVVWQVNGASGGSATTGTIVGGLYTPPATQPPAGNMVTLSATTVATPTATASQVETILNPTPVLTQATSATTATANLYTLDLTGSGFLPTSQVEVNHAATTTTFVSANELKVSVTVADATTTSLSVDVLNPDPGGSRSATATVSVGTTSATAAARLLDQATFGPTPADIAHVQSVGMSSYLAEQFAVAPTQPFSLSPSQPANCQQNTLNCLQSQWWQAVLTGKDQLRQRVAFALSEIFVVSTDSADTASVITYHNLLNADAFANFSTLIKDVTLSTAMGQYLNMLNSGKPAGGQIANENYPRELMQLFTLGLSPLNPDGSVNPSGEPVYTEAQVEAFARAYTGWTYATSSGGSPNRFPANAVNYSMPMAPVESAHDTTAKTLLLGTVLPAGQSAEQDLDGALANIFNHPNVGPFFCRQLIQHLVTGAPSAAYVERVAGIFADNGQGARGDLRAVITAILTDPEARAGDEDPTWDGGHLREAVLYLSAVMRGLGFVNIDSNGSYAAAANQTLLLGESPYQSPSVFNFFPPTYVIPGTSINSPEFGQENTATSIARADLAEVAVFNHVHGFSVDLSATSRLGLIASATGNAQTDAAALVDALGLLFLHGQMPELMRTPLVAQIAGISNIAQRVRVATYLVISSSFYKIEH